MLELVKHYHLDTLVPDGAHKNLVDIIVVGAPSISLHRTGHGARADQRNAATVTNPLAQYVSKMGHQQRFPGA
ncbi:hypothetical protein G6F68_014886 [Rhizopus microsporus]|nr:hypothetical protein G6F68_014886 [Rhizopus microsporus]